jgi:multicomponent Na+:H+ antiporter subunit D
MLAELLLLAPFLVPLTAASVSLLSRRRIVLQRIVGFAALAVTAACGVALTAVTLNAGVVHAVIGTDEALTGVALTADPLGAALVVATAVLTTAVLVAMAAAGDDDERPFLHPLVLVLVSGACGSFVAGDLFNLFVLFEVALIASYVLLVLGDELPTLRAAVVYTGVNLLGTLLLLTGIAGVFGVAGTLNIALLAEQTSVEQDAAMPGAVLVTIAFMLKAALLPFSGWLVVGYAAARRTTMALFAGTMTTIGIAALYRVVMLGFGGAEVLRLIVLGAAAATLPLAPLAAIKARDEGRVLALLIVAQVGFMGVGFGLGTAAGLAAGVYFILQDVLVKTAAVLAYRPLEARWPPSGALRTAAIATFAVLALSMIGMPPFAGFVGKALLVTAAFETRSWAIVAAMLAASAAMLAAVLALWRGPGERPAGTTATRDGTIAPPADLETLPQARWRSAVALAPAAVVALAALAAGVLPAGLLRLAEAAARVLLDPPAYAREVLGS